MFRFVSLILAFAALPLQAAPRHAALVEPSLHLASDHSLTPRVALTLDACTGGTDKRILDVLVENRIAATIFVTARWLKRNPETLAVFKAHPDLFELEDHGRDHVPAIDRATSVYGIKAAGSPEAVFSEVDGGAAAMMVAGLAKPHWFRGATAKYSPDAIAQIEAMGYRIAGYSLSGDGGSLLGAKVTAHRIANARDGDVIIAHINQPSHAAGAGVAEGILALKKKGFAFVLLRDAAEPEKAKLLRSASVGE